MYLELSEPGSFPNDSASPAPFSVRTRRFCQDKKNKKKKTSALLRTPDLLWSTAARLSKLGREAKSNAGVTPRQGKVNNSQLGKASRPHCVCSEGTQSGHSGRSLTSAPGNMSDDGGGGLFTVWSCDTTAASGLVAMATDDQAGKRLIMSRSEQRNSTACFFFCFCFDPFFCKRDLRFGNDEENLKLNCR